MPLHYVQHNYCGPFTEDFNVEPVNELDTCCRTHDLHYANPYVSTEAADRKLIECLQNTETISGYLIAGIIQAKGGVDRLTNYASDGMLRPGHKRRLEEKQQEAANKRARADDNTQQEEGNISDHEMADVDMGEPAVGQS